MKGVAARFHELPIGKKLILVFVLVSSIVLFLVESFFLMDRALAYQRDHRQGLASLAAMISHNSSAPLVFSDQESASQTMQSLSRHPDVVAGYLLDRDGSLFASYVRADAELEAGMVIATDNPPDRNLAVLGRYREEAAESLRWCAPIGVNDVVLEGERIGTVILLGSITPFLLEITRQAMVAFLVFLAACGLAFLVSRRLHRFISDPITMLTTLMHEVSLTKNFSVRADTSRSNGQEIDTLFHGFNEMLGEIEERNELLSQRQEHLQTLAHFDSLTGLANRVLFYDRLNQSIHHAQRFRQKVAIFFIDLDHFKDINDSLGHRIGDLLLIEVSRRLAERVRTSDTLARMGGDEFTMFAQNIGAAENVRIIAQHIFSAFKMPFQVDSHELFVTASIGYTIFPDDGTSIDQLLRNADMAMYFAKEQGKNSFKPFDASLTHHSSTRLAILNSLHHALERKEFFLVYQPKVSLGSGHITGLEALIRWQHPEDGIVSPTKFIPVAENTGLIVEITEWVLSEICRQLSVWQLEGRQVCPIAVNISAILFMRQAVVPMMAGVLSRTGTDSSLIEIEVTEGTLMASDDTHQQMEALKAMGIRIAVDDFGTGYSSLSYLQRFPVDTLKIDRSFIISLTTSKDNFNIVTAIIAMARSLGLGVVAEGVETSDQLTFLKKQDCDEVQGYMLSKPLLPEDVAVMLNNPRLLPTEYVSPLECSVSGGHTSPAGTLRSLPISVQD